MRKTKIVQNIFISLGVLFAPRLLAAASFITFDAPGAVFGTVPFDINSEGAITGYFNDANFISHGFLRDQNGTITTFDVPGAVDGVSPAVINPAGTIMGIFFDVNSFVHEFVRTHNGTITTFDVPGASFIDPNSINPAGTFVGDLVDVNFISHGFLRARDGAITTFDVPGGVNGTYAAGINPGGVITGMYTDASDVTHGYLRDRDGAITTFDSPSPGSLEVFAPFAPRFPDLLITPQGVVTGTYFEPIPGNPFGGNFRVYVRATDGTFTTFDAATYPPCCIWSFPSDMNPAGTITGSFNDGFTINHGFVRTSDGTITTFDAPGAGTGFNQGTFPLGITPGGVIMGVYVDENYLQHGFVRIP